MAIKYTSQHTSICFEKLEKSEVPYASRTAKKLTGEKVSRSVHSSELVECAWEVMLLPEAQKNVAENRQI
jgi:hypothetical protein